MTEFKVTESGWYRTSGGRDAEVVVNSEQKFVQPVIGYVVDGVVPQTWGRDGRMYKNFGCSLDLIEYLGKERPRQKKVVKMAPALCENLDGFFISDQLFDSEEKARKLSDFSRWLIDTHAVEVEVPDNG